MALEQATTLFAEVFGAVMIYNMLDEPSSALGDRVWPGRPGGSVDRGDPHAAPRRGPNLKLFVSSGPGQRGPVLPSEFGIRIASIPACPETAEDM
jgi:hypothetical protein